MYFNETEYLSELDPKGQLDLKDMNKLTIVILIVVLAIVIFYLYRYSCCPYYDIWAGFNSINESSDRETVLAALHLDAREDLKDISEGAKLVEDNQLIPKHIYQTHQEDYVPVNMKRAMDTIIDLNPEYSYTYYNDASQREFVESLGDDRLLNAFDTLVPKAFKTDLFRYCLLYKFGGVYLDAPFVALKPFREIISPGDEFISAVDIGVDKLYNAIICSVPGNPILKEAILLCITNIENRYYGKGSLDITGPGLLGTVFKRVTGKEINEMEEDGIKLLTFTINPMCVSGTIKYKGVDLFNTKYKGSRNDQKWYAANFSYTDMWKNKKVYIN